LLRYYDLPKKKKKKKKKQYWALGQQVKDYREENPNLDFKLPPCYKRRMLSFG
jgi:hypothetical protein